MRNPDNERQRSLGARRKNRSLAGLFILFIVPFSSDEVRADFYVWIDDNGRRVVSTIPKQGYTKNAELRDAFNPNSIVYQHRRVRDILSDHYADRVLPQQQEESVVVTPAHGAPKNDSRRDRTPKEGTMNLNELIELERRGGRYQALDSNQSEY